MNGIVVHSGFDGLRLTVGTDISPEFHKKLLKAKAHAQVSHEEVIVEHSGKGFSVRASGGRGFSFHTGEYGAEWYCLDPQCRPKNNPGITIDFRAFLLATGGLEDAEAHFRDYMSVVADKYSENIVRFSRIDYAVDILAPDFIPGRECLVLPPGTGVSELEPPSETQAVGARVTGLRAGAVANRQLAIYDKRSEVLKKHKAGWLEIWNAELAAQDLPAMDLSDREKSQVWRFELRTGSKQLRRNWEIIGWDSIHERVGDLFVDFCGRFRYVVPSQDANRSRWPNDPLWDQVSKVVAQGLETHRIGILPSTVRDTNRREHNDMLDRQLLGLFVSRAAASNVKADEFDEFLGHHVGTLLQISNDHPTPLGERIDKASSRYRFK